MLCKPHDNSKGNTCITQKNVIKSKHTAIKKQIMEKDIKKRGIDIRHNQKKINKMARVSSYL